MEVHDEGANGKLRPVAGHRDVSLPTVTVRGGSKESDTEGDRGEAHIKDEIMPKYAETIYNGLWFCRFANGFLNFF